MRAAVTTEGGGFEVTTLPDPTPEADQLVIRVTACGVCGSDLKAHRYMAPGTVMGHEMCGEVVAVGRDVRGAWREGAKAAVLPLISCGRCDACVRGEVAHCKTMRSMGMGPDHGGFAEYVVAPARQAFCLPDEIPAEYGALVEPFAVGLHAVEAAGVQPGAKVLVVGAGGVGQTAIAWARWLGADRITAADPMAERLKLARAMGATDVLASAAEVEPEAYDAIIECVGRPEILSQCVASAAHRGTIVIAGACPEPMPLPGAASLKKELAVRFSVAYGPRDFERVIEAFAGGFIAPAPLLGPSVGLDRVGEAIEMVRTVESQGRVRVVP